ADGTPPSFVILATADLRHWRRYGQGGHATMGVFRLGAGTVFNAATVNWGSRLADPVVDRITRNVLDRLSAPHDPARWDAIGPAGPSPSRAPTARSSPSPPTTESTACRWPGSPGATTPGPTPAAPPGRRASPRPAGCSSPSTAAPGC